ncbi:hypothetical protein BLA24_13155 [Streptomyces cinnamoneus]|uniref:Uncharacterized protein n=1 Tax=Streptomyces cinnamoneus TaxID=53446 RepID=A0A2G1XJS8_STRCJ|nr:hypothetical protein [Streptomyces cinnamoneus]PHQ51460.1 hypothetical protein BLA24_13155 [Streptomyces cinnamoneus]
MANGRLPLFGEAAVFAGRSSARAVEPPGPGAAPTSSPAASRAEAKVGADRAGRTSGRRDGGLAE